MKMSSVTYGYFSNLFKNTTVEYNFFRNYTLFLEMFFYVMALQWMLPLLRFSATGFMSVTAWASEVV